MVVSYRKFTLFRLKYPAPAMLFVQPKQAASQNMRLTKRVKGHLAFSVLLKVSCLHGELVVVIIPDLKGALQRAVALFNANVPLN